MASALERAARAVGDVVGYRGDIIAKDSLAVDIARAVLMAVRGIDVETAAKLLGQERSAATDFALADFEAMIDAILAGEA